MTAKEAALNMMKKDSIERAEAEKMMGARFEEMTQEQRRLAAACIAAFYEEIKGGKQS